MEGFYKRLAKVQVELKAPKSQFNSFGKYHYRSCEDILEAAKPLCAANGMVLTVRDDIVQIGDRYYVKATASIRDTESDLVESTTAYAREENEKKGMDASQVTGSSSSYARKYALNGLFSIDDNKDADTDEQTAKTTGKEMPKKSQQSKQPKDEHQTTKADTPKADKIVCGSCGCEITDYKKADGTVIPANKVFQGCGGMCLSCYNKNKKGE